MSPTEDNAADRRLRALADFAARTADPSLTEVADELAADVMTRLERAEVPFLLLKGPALARFLYRPGEQRRYMDVDLLVRPDAQKRAGEILHELGFENITEREGVDGFTGAVHAEKWQRLGRLPVDLHLRLPGCALPPEEAWPLLFDGHQTTQVAGFMAPVLSRAGLALHLALHAAQHGPDDLKALGDLERGLERWPREDWEAAASLAAALHGAEMLAAGLELLPKGRELARVVPLPASGEPSWAIPNHAERPRGAFHLAALDRARGPKGIAEVLLRALLPRPAWIVREYPWAARGRAMLIAGYASHLLRTPVWAARAWRYRRQMRRAAQSD